MIPLNVYNVYFDKFNDEPTKVVRESLNRPDLNRSGNNFNFSDYLSSVYE
ncbi:hypothetical protein BANRA_03834 [Klebsiella pneumoniae]|nr:hypothetical protein BANRA_03834 [Klebsiella pneumoniae]